MRQFRRLLTFAALLGLYVGALWLGAHLS